jgi:hypothetical protein
VKVAADGGAQTAVGDHIGRPYAVAVAPPPQHTSFA